MGDVLRREIGGHEIAESLADVAVGLVSIRSQSVGGRDDAKKRKERRLVGSQQDWNAVQVDLMEPGHRGLNLRISVAQGRTDPAAGALPASVRDLRWVSRTAADRRRRTRSRAIVRGSTRMSSVDP